MPPASGKKLCRVFGRRTAGHFCKKAHRQDRAYAQPAPRLDPAGTSTNRSRKPFLFCFSQLAEQKNLQLHARNGLFRLIIVLFQYVKSKKQLVSKTFVDFLSGSGILVHCPYIQALHCRQNAARFAGKSPRSRPETNAQKGFCGMHQAKCTRKKLLPESSMILFSQLARQK